MREIDISQFSVIGVKLKSSLDYVIYDEEAGLGAVADLSGVDGLNFDVKYELLNAANTGKKVVMSTKPNNINPCKGIINPMTKSPFKTICSGGTVEYENVVLINVQMNFLLLHLNPPHNVILMNVLKVNLIQVEIPINLLKIT